MGGEVAAPVMHCPRRTDGYSFKRESEGMASIRLMILVATAGRVVPASACRNRDPGDPPGTAKCAASRAPASSSAEPRVRPSASGRPRPSGESTRTVEPARRPVEIGIVEGEVTVDREVLFLLELQFVTVRKDGWLEAGGYRVG